MKRTGISLIIALCIICFLPGLTSAREGGPDLFGYTYRDMYENDGPEYDFIDITGTGTWVGDFGGYDDRALGPFNIGFTFPIYFWGYTQFYVSTNGLVTFGGSSTSYTNECMPYTTLDDEAEPFSEASSTGKLDTKTWTGLNMIAVFWDDLAIYPTEYSEDFSESVAVPFSAVYYQYFASSPHPDIDGPCLVIQWHNAAYLSWYDYFDFEVILSYNGDFLVQVGSKDGGFYDESTIGLQSAWDYLGLAYNDPCDEGYLTNNLAVLFDADYNPPSEGTEEEEEEIKSQIVKETEDDTFLGIPCFISAAAGHAGGLLPVIMAALAVCGVLIRQKMMK